MPFYADGIAPGNRFVSSRLCVMEQKVRTLVLTIAMVLTDTDVLITGGCDMGTGLIRGQD